jgi:hypothetical protein
VEIGTAVALVVLGGLVSTASLTHDIGWRESGPGTGYFPFRVGLLLSAAGVALIIQSLGVQVDAVFATSQDLRRTLSVFWPTAALAGGTIVLGSYVPSGLFLAWMMRRHGGYGWLSSAAFGAVAVSVFYAIFDLWFRVPLAKGPLEAALGLY